MLIDNIDTSHGWSNGKSLCWFSRCEDEYNKVDGVVGGIQSYPGDGVYSLGEFALCGGIFSQAMDFSYHIGGEP